MAERYAYMVFKEDTMLLSSNLKFFISQKQNTLKIQILHLMMAVL